VAPLEPGRGIERPQAMHFDSIHRTDATKKLVLQLRPIRTKHQTTVGTKMTCQKYSAKLKLYIDKVVDKKIIPRHHQKVLHPRQLFEKQTADIESNRHRLIDPVPDQFQTTSRE
jgi:hypothetical protein